VAEVRLARRAIKDLDVLPDKVAGRIVDLIEKFSKNPQGPEFDVKLLVGRRPWRRLRTRDHRILFRFSDGGKVLLVGRVVDRKELEQAVLTLPD
jgi:mRNA-degrading endonuclease RelE of RelBE toxin-antitoxin system